MQVSGDEDWQKVTLYHHCDGYPAGMLPLFAEAFDKFGGEDYRLGRAGHAAAFLCATDPGGFEPESGHDLHGDIEYYYRLHVASPDGPYCGARQRWEVEAWSTRDGATAAKPGKLILPKTEVHEAAKRADSLESDEDE